MKKLKDIVSRLGYKENSPFKESSFLEINTPTGQITMKGVKIPLLAISNKNEKKIMLPEQEYQFKGDNVLEIPLKLKCGGKMKKRYASGGMINGMNPEEFLSQSANTLNNVNMGIETIGNIGSQIGDAIVPGLGTAIQGGTKLLQLGVQGVDAIFNANKRKQANAMIALKQKDLLTQQINNKVKQSVGYI
jgi:hypothetical protein